MGRNQWWTIHIALCTGTCIDHNIPLEHVAAWTASNPATRFELADRKGSIAIGMDADLAIVNLNEAFTVTEENYYAKHKQSLYIGHTFPSSIAGTIVRGHVVVQDAKVLPSANEGSWQKP